MHEQNGTAERKIRRLVDTALTLLAYAYLPKKFWNYTLEQSTVLVNAFSSDVLQHQSPFYKLFHRHPNYLDFQPFGCVVFPLNRPYNSHKFSYRSLPCIYLGQSPLHATYHYLDPQTGRLYLAKHVKFHSNSFPYSSPSSSPLPQLVVNLWLMVEWAPTSCSSPATSSINLSSPSTSAPVSSSVTPP
jgi:hypothetical protein